MDETRPKIKWEVTRDPDKLSRDYKSPTVPGRSCSGQIGGAGFKHVAQRVLKWWDPRTKNWVVYRICEDNFQMGPSVYVYSETSADIAAQQMLEFLDTYDDETGG